MLFIFFSLSNLLPERKNCKTLEMESLDTVLWLFAPVLFYSGYLKVYISFFSLAAKSDMRSSHDIALRRVHSTEEKKDNDGLSCSTVNHNLFLIGDNLKKALSPSHTEMGS